MKRQAFQNGGEAIVPKPKPLTESQIKNKLDLYIKGFIGGFDKMEMVDLMNDLSKKADESGVMSQEDVFEFVKERKDFYQKFLEENQGEAVEFPRTEFSDGTDDRRMYSGRMMTEDQIEALKERRRVPKKEGMVFDKETKEFRPRKKVELTPGMSEKGAKAKAVKTSEKLKNFVTEFTEKNKRPPTIMEVANQTNSATKSIKKYLTEGVDYTKTDLSEVGKKGGEKSAVVRAVPEGQDPSYVKRYKTLQEANKFLSAQDKKDFKKINDGKKFINKYFKDNPEAINTTEFGKNIKQLLSLRMDKDTGALFSKVRPDDYYIDKAKEGKLFDIFDIKAVKEGGKSLRFPTNVNLTPGQFNQVFLQSQVGKYFAKGANPEALKNVEDILNKYNIRVKLPEVGYVGKDNPVAVDRARGEFPKITDTLKSMEAPEEILDKFKRSSIDQIKDMDIKMPSDSKGFVSTDLLKDVGKFGLKTIGSLPVAVGLAADTTKRGMDEGKSFIDAVTQPMVGVDLLFPEAFKKLGPLMAKAARVSTPIGAGITSIGLAKDFIKAGIKEKQFIDSLTPFQKQQYLEGEVAPLMDEGGMLADGGRVGYADGPDDPGKRKFLKIMGGLASLPLVGRFFRVGEMAAPVAEKAAETVSEAPKYFFDLVNKIKLLGTESKIKPSERVTETNYTGMDGSEYTLTEDSVTGLQRIEKDKIGGYADENVSFDTIENKSVMEYQPSRTTEDGIEPELYEESTAAFDRDGTIGDFDDGIDDSIIEQIKKEVDPD